MALCPQIKILSVSQEWSSSTLVRWWASDCVLIPLSECDETDSALLIRDNGMTSISKSDDPFTCSRTGFLFTLFIFKLPTVNSAPDSISFEISCNSQGSPNCRHFSVVSHFLFVQWCSFSSINTLLAHSTRHDVTGKGCKIILISWSETPAFVLNDSISNGRVPSFPYSMIVDTTRLSWV